MNNRQKFEKANFASPVVDGAVIGNGGQGGRYTLKDGQTFTLDRDECARLSRGFPKWDL